MSTKKQADNIVRYQMKAHFGETYRRTSDLKKKIMTVIRKILNTSK